MGQGGPWPGHALGYAASKVAPAALFAVEAGATPAGYEALGNRVAQAALGFPIDSPPPHFHHTVWSECGRSVARMRPNSGHVAIVVTPPNLHHKPTRKVADFVVQLQQIVVPEPPTLGPH